MSVLSLRPDLRRILSSAALVLVLAAGHGGGARAQMGDISSAFDRSVAAAASADAAVAQWYRETGYATLWTGPQDVARRAALFEALATAGDHGLPVARYDAAGLRAGFHTARTEGDLGRLEVAMTRAYLTFARDLTSGMLEPAKIDKTIVREIVPRDPGEMLLAVAMGDPRAALADLVPKSNAYAQLVRAKIGLEEAMGMDGWGAPVPGAGLRPGDSGARVVALRDRLIAMGYLARSATRDYDAAVQAAVHAFQLAHGLPADGVAGGDTLAEINKTPEERLKSVLVAMERERWMEIDREGRIIWVNLPDMTARIVDDGATVFRTVAVIGREDMDRRTPEFSDMMDHMVVNPSWGVPRSIIVGEYLPQLQRNRNAASHMQIIDQQGRVVPRGSVNFASYTARTFPFGMRQPPGDNNALGKVKFMFPNKYNIYLHDTPAKSLFSHDRRAYSHGCIRLADPFAFAHMLFGPEIERIEEEFDRILKTRNETRVTLERKIPIHMVYFTAYPEGKGRIGYRRDIYDRDARLWAAMAEAGVALGPVSQ
ncbi:L,D-transpeptidase family protein [Pseudogemmobacter sonorensis]|uniref:L,D-transpeptidase family protein n=1 Tax=Pseudogemmobacter sonorensis TaxID=2989681 RepID=UPI003679CF27